MKRLFIFISVLMAGISLGLGQSPESDLLYQTGVELYREGKYAQAKEYFAKSNSLDAVEIDSLSSRRFYSPAWLAACFYKLGENDSARKYDPHYYKLEPVDRSLTVEIDSLIDLANRDMEAGRFFIPLSTLKTVQEKEKALFDRDHYAHIGTNRMLAICNIQCSHLDDAIPLLEESRRLIKLNFGDTDTLQIQEDNFLLDLYINKQDFDKATELVEDMWNIAKANYDDNHKSRLELKFVEFVLMASQRQWSSIKNGLPKYIDLLFSICGDNPALLEQELFKILQFCDNCGLKEECAYIDDRILQHKDQSDNQEEVFYANLLKLTSEANLKDYEAAKKTIANLRSLANSLPEKGSMERKAVIEAMEIGVAIGENRLDDAKDIYLKMESDSINQYIEGNDALYEYEWVKPVYLSAKMSVNLVLSEYEKAAEVADKIAEITQAANIDNLSVNAYQGTINAMAGNYKKAKDITKETTNRWRTEVLEPKLLFRLDADTAQLNTVTTIIDNYLETYSVADSARYTMREIKSEYLRLKADLLKNLPNYAIDYDYYDAVSDYAFELVKTGKYPEAQEVMDEWLKDWMAAYNALPKNPDDIVAELDRIMARITLDEALKFRSRWCYEKGDPAGRKAFEDVLDFQREEGSGSEDTPYFRQAKIEFLEYLDDDAALQDYLLEAYEKDPQDFSLNDYDKLIDVLQKNGDKENSINFLKKQLELLAGNSKFMEENQFLVSKKLSSLIDYYAKEKNSPELAMQYLAEEFWPALEEEPQLLFDYFIISIDELARDIKDDSFIPYVAEFIEKHPGLVSDAYKEAAIYQTMAGVLLWGDLKDQGIDYLNKAIDLAKGDEALELLFQCNLHEAYSMTSRKDDLIALGEILIQKMGEDEKLRFTHEYNAVVERQIKALLSKKEYEKAAMLGENYISEIAPHQDIFINILNESHPNYEEISAISSNTLHDYTILGGNFIREMWLSAQSVVNPEIGTSLALDVINDKYDSIETSLSLSNKVPDWLCDDLISISSKYAYSMPGDSLKMAAYDAALYTKGLQIRSDNAIRALIEKSGHKGALRKFDDLQDVNRKLASATPQQYDSLNNLKNALEKDLLKLSKNFGDYKKSLYASWKDVREALNDDDLAMEITLVKRDYYDPEEANFKYGYYASVLKKDMEAPEIIFLGENFDSDKSIYKSAETAKTIFTPLQPFLEGVKNIYFSPAGVFNQISVESLPYQSDDDRSVSSVYNIFRVSSTREILPDQFAVEGHDAVVYGGLSYDTSLEELTSDSRKYQRDLMLLQDDSDPDLIDLRGFVRSIPYLVGTKKEAEDVVATINGANIDSLFATPYIGKDGTEASFKALNGKQNRIIHVATHGFYFSKDDMKKLSKGNDRDAQNPALQQEDNSLLRSGLLFAGAANKYKGVALPAGLDDGILTSYEISNIDLSGLDLCVLSACQTAQGDISSEGVYGLQRGLKIAGAKSILMSLWPVDDEATCELMTEFYHQYITNNKSKHEALEIAKDSVKAHREKGWHDPKYWAAFILLDGIN